MRLIPQPDGHDLSRLLEQLVPGFAIERDDVSL